MDKSICPREMKFMVGKAEGYCRLLPTYAFKEQKLLFLQHQ
jgi:hypothetical protein